MSDRVVIPKENLTAFERWELASFDTHAGGKHQGGAKKPASAALPVAWPGSGPSGAVGGAPSATPTPSFAPSTHRLSDQNTRRPARLSGRRAAQGSGSADRGDAQDTD